MAKAVESVIFYMDGTLIDAREWHFRSLNEALQIFGEEISIEEHLSSFDGLVSASSIGRGGILSCLEAICQGGHYIDKLLQNIANESSHTVWNELNQREREILPLLARGLKNKEIAAELFIAETTTRDYVSVILAKLQVSNRAAAAAWAIEHGLTGE